MTSSTSSTSTPRSTVLAEHNLLYLVVSKFADLDLRTDNVSNLEMGYIYEELIRRFSELSNETAGEHFTPREVIRLMVNLLFVDDDELLTKPGIVKTMLDPACGTGGMLSVAEEYLRNLNPQGRLEVYGQEVNAETYATCRADMLIKGQNASRIRFGNSFDNDQHPNRRFDYLLANPPFGVEWKMVANHVKSEHKTKGFAGRFGAGTPRINDGSFLFLQHMISKMKRPDEGGARLAIVFNGSPLFTGAAGSGESEIRRWVIENDWLEAVVALPDQLFYNTGISTYFWVVTNRKSPKRRGKSSSSTPASRGPRCEKASATNANRSATNRSPNSPASTAPSKKAPGVKIFPNESFGFLRITVERPLQLRWEITDDTVGAVATDKKVAKLPPLMQELLTRQAPSQPRRHLPNRENRQGVREGRPRLGHRRQTDSAGQRGRKRSRSSRPRRARHHNAKRQTQTRPHPPGLRERTPTTQTSHPRDRHQQTARHPRIPNRHRRLPRRPKSTPTSPTPGTTPPKPKSATKSPSPATSTPTPHPAPSTKSTTKSKPSKTKSKPSSQRSLQ